jgi:hypothetical protein
MGQSADSLTGNARAIGTNGDSSIGANAFANSYFAKGGSSNSGARGIVNKGVAIAYTNNASSYAGVWPPTPGENGSGSKPGGISTSTNANTNPAHSSSRSQTGAGKLISAVYGHWSKNGYHGPSMFAYSIGDGYGSGDESEIGKGYPDSDTGSDQGHSKHSKAGVSTWVWFLLMFLFAAWAALTMKAKPWRSLRLK